MEVRIHTDFASSVIVPDPDVPGEFVQIPDPITATIVDGPWDATFLIRIDAEGLPYVDELLMKKRDGGDAITPSNFRALKLGEATVEAVRKASIKVVREGQVMRMIGDGFNVTKSEAKLAFRKVRKNTPTTARYIEAAKAYNRFKSEGRRDALVAAAAEINQTRSTTYRWIKKAEELGLDITEES